MKSLLNTLKKYTKRAVTTPRLYRPHRDWYVLLGVVSVLLLCGVVFHITRFQHFAALPAQVEPTQEPAVEYDHALVASVLERYEARQRQLTRMAGEMPSPATNTPLTNRSAASTSTATSSLPERIERAQ